MYYFTARIEINNADHEDYVLLHAALKTILFFRAILGDTGYWYDLPTGEYVRISDDTLQFVRDLLERTLQAFIARKPINDKGFRKTYEFFLGRADSLSWSLPRNTDVTKRP
jgi:hypothetical protein